MPEFGSADPRCALDENDNEVTANQNSVLNLNCSSTDPSGELIKLQTVDSCLTFDSASLPKMLRRKRNRETQSMYLLTAGADFELREIQTTPLGQPANRALETGHSSRSGCADRGATNESRVKGS